MATQSSSSSLPSLAPGRRRQGAALAGRRTIADTKARDPDTLPWGTQAERSAHLQRADGRASSQKPIDDRAPSGGFRQDPGTARRRARQRPRKPKAQTSAAGTPGSCGGRNTLVDWSVAMVSLGGWFLRSCSRFGPRYSVASSSPMPRRGLVRIARRGRGGWPRTAAFVLVGVVISSVGICRFHSGRRSRWRGRLGRVCGHRAESGVCRLGGA